jgi:succinate-semialdehyde dehydrogenase/glutarate-semialdehyde dehydrogenase
MSTELIQSVPTGLFIGGQWLDSSDGGRIEVTDPATEEVIASVASGTPEDATLAVEAAYEAGKSWAATAPRERAEVLRAAFELLTARKDDIAVIMSREEGKTRAEGLGETACAAEFFRADPDVAIEGSMIAKLRNAGESCIAANRFYVHSSIKDEFAERFAAEMAKLTVGPGLESGVDIGPLVDASTRDKVTQLVDDAVA